VVADGIARTVLANGSVRREGLEGVRSREDIENDVEAVLADAQRALAREAVLANELAELLASAAL